MDAVDGIRRSCPRRSVRTALPHAARYTGRVAAGRAGSFNSGKNYIHEAFKSRVCTCAAKFANNHEVLSLVSRVMCLYSVVLQMFKFHSNHVRI